MKASKYQEAIYTWIRNSTGNCIIQAVAGSGKTTTIIEASKLFPANSKSIFLAFNTAIAKELKSRLPNNINACTLHSLGLGMFSSNTNIRPEVDSYKLDNIITNVLENNNIGEEDRIYMPYKIFLRRIIPLCKATLININFEELYDLVERYNIDTEINEEIIHIIKQVLERCKSETSIIDFDDMLWIPIVNNFKAYSYDWILVDECQDLNKCQFELIKKIFGKNTRAIFVGDEKQSIYAFRGADTTSMSKLKEYFNAKELPLSICYRCPQKVIQLAKEIVPIIEASDIAKEGVVEEISVDEAVKIVKDKDLILCRTNAPLVKMAFNLIRNGKKAVIRGRDIGKNLITTINKYKVRNLEDLIEKIQDFQLLQIEKIKLIEKGQMDRRKKRGLVTLVDSCETILVLAENVQTIEELKQKIEDIFTDELGGIICSSIHKAKGLEADVVFILEYGNMPHPMAKTEEEMEQEINIKYVALTRSKNSLYFIEE